MAQPASIPLITFQEFYAIEDAQTLLDLLKKHKIYHKVEAPRPIMDKVMGGNPVTPKYFVKIYADDFKQVNLLFELETFHALKEGKISTDNHFLEDYTLEELEEVVKKPYEWSPETAAMARFILQTRGVTIDDETLEKIRAERITDFAKPRKGHYGWIVFMYIMSLGSLLLFPLSLAAYLATLSICLGMSQHYWRDVTTDPYGKRFYTFNRATRRHGKVLFWLSLSINGIFQIWNWLIPH